MASSGTVLITGCASGMGEATARRLAEKGWRVFATARSANDLGTLAAAGCETLDLTVGNEASMAAAVATVIERSGRIDALVNNAGYSLSGALESLSLDQVRHQFETNVFGLLRMCQLVLPHMRDAGSGRIVNISSMGGTLTFPGGGAYHASKHAVEAMSDAMRFEVAGFGIKVVVIQPGIIRTGFAKAALDAMPASDAGPYGAFNTAVAAATRDVYEKGMLARLGGDADDVARVVERALTAPRPKARYPVTASATMMINQRRLMSDRLWDAFLRTNFPTPGVNRAK
jgi:NAD(P)-dependent dehydrogenase (short-subunit alcohol dehydrogenase family)